MMLFLLLLFAGLAWHYAGRARAARREVHMLRQGQIDWAGYHTDKRRYLGREHLG